VEKTGDLLCLRQRSESHNSLFADVFVPDLGILRNIRGQHSNAFVRMGVEHFRAVLAEPVEAAAEIYGFPDHYGADAELANQAAAIPARGQGSHHDFVAVTALAARLSKRIRFAMRGRITFLHSAVVAASQQFSIAFE
jgi:hypothetical protein